MGNIQVLELGFELQTGCNDFDTFISEWVTTKVKLLDERVADSLLNEFCLVFCECDCIEGEIEALQRKLLDWTYVNRFTISPSNLYDILKRSRSSIHMLVKVLSFKFIKLIVGLFLNRVKLIFILLITFSEALKDLDQTLSTDLHSA